MEDWILSAEALETKSEMLQRDFSIYVEGQDDILFWESLFHKSGIQNFHIEEVGGYEFLKPYMRRILSDDANIIVACDSHYTEFDIDYEVHDRVIRTYGYSIENTMYNSMRINLIIKKYCLRNFDITDEIEEWMLDFSNQIHDLLVYHIANVKFKKTKPILRDKCIEYLISNKSPNLSSEKIDKKLSEVATHVGEECVNDIVEKLEIIDKPTWHLLKGHFLTNAVLNFIKKKIKDFRNKTVAISIETLYAHCVNMNEFDTSSLYDVNHKTVLIGKAVESVKSHSD